MGEENKERLSAMGTNPEGEPGLKDDKSLRIGSSHGEATERDDQYGYARDIKASGEEEPQGREERVRGAGLGSRTRRHPSKSLDLRARGYGIGGGYERPYRKERPKTTDSDRELYGPLPHAGYYGAGIGTRPFKLGQASFKEEIKWYGSQYGENTSGYDKKK